MTANEAYKILKSAYPGMESISAYEYSGCFVFVTQPATGFPGEHDEMSYTVFGVDKRSRKVFVFKPFMISPSDYNSGKRINNYK